MLGRLRRRLMLVKAKAVQNNVSFFTGYPRPANNLDNFFFKKEEKQADIPAESLEKTEAVIESIEENHNRLKKWKLQRRLKKNQ